MTKRVNRSSDGKYHIKGKKYIMLVGSRAQVWHENAYKTPGGLVKGDLIMNSAKRIVSENFQETFRFDSQKDTYVSLTPSRGGNFSLSFLAIKTAFVKDDNLNNSPTFERFAKNRLIIRDRLNSLNTQGEYGLNSQDVLIPAFI